jgi:hypothetical protein
MSNNKLTITLVIDSYVHPIEKEKIVKAISNIPLRHANGGFSKSIVSVTASQNGYTQKTCKNCGKPFECLGCINNSQLCSCGKCIKIKTPYTTPCDIKYRGGKQ